jgi:hypothetical protein
MFKDNSPTLPERLRIDLLRARKTGDQFTTTTLQAVIAAIDNASAVPISKKNISTIGVGSTEMPRRELSEQDIEEILKHEIAGLQHAIDEFDGIKNPYVDELNKKITILENYL